jgi:hypothetical protein
LPSSSNYRNGWERSVNGIFVTELPGMVGVPTIFTDIVTIKEPQWFWRKLMIVFLADTLTNTGNLQVCKKIFIYKYLHHL